MPEEDFNELGLRNSDMVFLENLFSGTPEIEKVFVFGSRARGDFKRGSDLDLAIEGAKVNHEILIKLKSKIELESNLLLYFDLVHFDDIQNDFLRKKIIDEGKLIYQAN